MYGGEMTWNDGLALNFVRRLSDTYVVQFSSGWLTEWSLLGVNWGGAAGRGPARNDTHSVSHPS